MRELTEPVLKAERVQRSERQELESYARGKTQPKPLGVRFCASTRDPASVRSVPPSVVENTA